MYICYYDESGDDGFPKYSSPFFIFTATYIHHLDWKETYSAIHNFRQSIRKDFNLPVKYEMHTKKFILNKNPYRQLSISDSDRLSIIFRFCELISKLNIKVINTCIVKQRIIKQDYKVLDTALTYSIQRIENDLRSNENERFMVITDAGRVGKMCSTIRRIQKINYIPSKYYHALYRKEIGLLIEDPLPKDSKQSHYIQISDLISYIVYLYTINHLKIGGFSNRLQKIIDIDIVTKWMKCLSPVFNLKASRSNEYGVVYYPK